MTKSIFKRNRLILTAPFCLWSLNFTIFMKLCLLFYGFTYYFTIWLNRFVCIFCFRLTFFRNQLIDHFHQCLAFTSQLFCEKFKSIFYHMFSSFSLQNFHNLTPMPIVVDHMLKETNIFLYCPWAFIYSLTDMIIPTLTNMFWWKISFGVCFVENKARGFIPVTLPAFPE